MYEPLVWVNKQGYFAALEACRALNQAARCGLDEELAEQMGVTVWVIPSRDERRRSRNRDKQFDSCWRE